MEEKSTAEKMRNKNQGICKSILTNDDRKKFICEDAKANGMNCSYLRYLLGLVYGLERAHAFRYSSFGFRFHAV